MPISRLSHFTPGAKEVAKRWTFSKIIEETNSEERRAISCHTYGAGDFMSRLRHCGSKTSVLQTFYYHLSLLQCQPNMYSMLLDCLSCIWFNVVQLFRVRLNKVLLLDFFTWFLIPDPGWSENSDTLCDLVSLLSRFLGEDSSWPPSYAS